VRGVKNPERLALLRLGGIADVDRGHVAQRTTRGCTGLFDKIPKGVILEACEREDKLRRAQQSPRKLNQTSVY